MQLGSPGLTRFLTLSSRAVTDTKSALHESDDAHKVRMQLVRARKDMRDLWLERDELAKLAGGAMQVRNKVTVIQDGKTNESDAVDAMMSIVRGRR